MSRGVSKRTLLPGLDAAPRPAPIGGRPAIVADGATRITRLDLRAYGPFDGVALDFPESGPGLQLILGPNEAGKSSALRALRCALFGYPARTPDNHRFDYKNFRVGATLRGPTGDSLSFLRRKTNARSLRATDDETELSDDALAPFLGGIDEARFCAAHLSTLQELADGGQAIIGGSGGDLGSILFGASGLARLPQIRKILDDDAGELFKKGARLPKINAGLAGLDEARKVARDRSLPPSEWIEADRGKSDAIAEVAAIDAELAEVDASRRRLARLGRALPLLAARRAAIDVLAGLADVPILSDGFAGRRLAAVAERSAAESTAEASRRGIEGVEAEVIAAEAGLAEGMLAEGRAIGVLREEIGGLRKATARRPRLVADADRLEAEAGAILRDLAPGRPIAEAEALRVGKARRAEVAALGREREAIGRDVARLGDEVKALARSLGDGSVPVDPLALDDLAATVARVQKLGDPEAKAVAARAEATRLAAESDVELARLPRWSGSLELLATLAVPGPEAVEALTRDRGDAEARRLRAIDDLRSNADEREAVDEQIAGARAGVAPPHPDDLDRDRSRRDAGWAAIRRAWLGEGEPTPPDPALARSYEGLVASADATSDRLRREADRVATLAAIEARRGRLVEKAARLDAELVAAEADLNRAIAAWDEAWRLAGIEAGPPSEMRGWSTRHRDLIARAAATRSARLAADLAESELARAADAIGSGLEAIGEPAADPGLAARVARATRAVARGADARKLAEARQSLADAESLREDWRSRWAAAVAPLGLAADATPELANEAIERADDLLSRLEKAAKARLEVAEIDRDADRHDREVAVVARRVGMEAVEEPLPAMVAALAEAERARERHVATTRRLDAERERLEVAEATLRDRDALLDALRREAGVASVDDLPEAERRSAESRAAHERLDELERDLIALGAGATLAELAADAEAELDGSDPDSLPGRDRPLAERAEALLARRDELHRRIGGLQEQLSRMDGRASASVALEESRQWLAGLEADVEQYARLRLASAVLRRAIDRYRERHQGPILRRLGGLFAELTAGGFAGVKLEDASETDTRQVLRGVRPGPDGATVPVEGMSEGTADALYLAVRLATLEHQLDESRGALPFVVDDILVHFDDARASAALGALARLAGRTQVLFFTHHRHLVELARSALPAGSWSLHELPSRPLSPPVADRA